MNMARAELLGLRDGRREGFLEEAPDPWGHVGLGLGTQVQLHNWWLDAEI